MIDLTKSRIGLGCMRLSTDPDRDDARGVAVIHAALDAGITLVDTADSYCHDTADFGHNERLIARALATWSGDRSSIRVATKGGLTRPAGRWESDGRAKYLVSACAASLRALDLERIDLYQLHAPDPRTPLATSIRALAALKRDGLIAAIGLCNVTVGQIEEASQLAKIEAVQVELSVWNDRHLLSGVVEYCRDRRIPLLAHRPLGGPRRRLRTLADPVLAEIAARHEGATPFDVALAWLMDLSDLIVPLPGATQAGTARAIARATQLVLSARDREQLDERVPAGRVLRPQYRPKASAPPRQDGEVVIIMGLPGAGKSTLAATLTAQGYLRINRDESGGTLRQLVLALDRALAAGASRIVLDNTYVSRKSRAEVIRAACERGMPVRCLWLATSIEDAQTNAAQRIVSRYGRLPSDTELNWLRKHDVSAFLPTTQFRYQRELEPPDVSEGFATVEIVGFERRYDPARVGRAILVWCDGVLLRSRSGLRVPLMPDDVEVIAERGAILRQYASAGWQLLGLSWQAEIAEGMQSSDGAAAVFARMRELLDLPIDVEYCPHAAGPPACWCRKPLPGLGVALVERQRLDPRRCIYVAGGSQDPGFARRLGFQYAEATSFFSRADGVDIRVNDRP